MDDLFSSINGLVLPGGSGDLWYGHPFFDTAADLLRRARAANDAGGVFPVFGVCLGFETLHILLANRTREELLVPSVGQEVRRRAGRGGAGAGRGRGAAVDSPLVLALSLLLPGDHPGFTRTPWRRA